MATLKSIKNKYLTNSDGAVLGVTTNTENVSALGFKLSTADSLSKFNLVDGFVDDYNDATGVDASASTGETRDSTGKYYSGSAPASGGTQTSYGAYSVFTFLSSGTFVAGQAGTGDILVVGGGGSSGGNQNGWCGGGGAGGMVVAAGVTIAAGSHTVTVGDGGAAAINYSSNGNNGANSSWVFGTPATLELIGVGGGKSVGGGGGGSAGGCGGGGGGDGNDGEQKPRGATTQSTPTTGTWSSVNAYGRVGAYGYAGGGGGGGVGGDATSGHSSNTNCEGGAGLQNLYRTGSNVYYGGGGAGGAYSGSGAGDGGVGGGGPAYSNQNGASGTANTGGGGGGTVSAGPQYVGGAGGSGIVVMRTTSDLGSIVNMTLQSNVYTAQANPTTIRVMMDEYTAAGSTTLDTDIKAYASRDNGTTWTQTALTSQATIDTNHRFLSGSADVSGQPAGANVKYKIETLNQAVGKQTRIYGTSLAWA